MNNQVTLATTLNIPQIVADHAPGCLARMDQEISQLTNKLSGLMLQRALLEVHSRVQQSMLDKVGS